MNTILRIRIVVILLCIVAIPVIAQDNERVYKEGSVWSISYIKTKPGQFDTYLKNLNETWKLYQEQYIKDGKTIS